MGWSGVSSGSLRGSIATTPVTISADARVPDKQTAGVAAGGDQLGFDRAGVQGEAGGRVIERVVALVDPWQGGDHVGVGGGALVVADAHMDVVGLGGDAHHSLSFESPLPAMRPATAVRRSLDADGRLAPRQAAEEAR